MAKIQLTGISKRFADGTQALAPSDLVIEDGELFVLVGPSGCGKSTLLRIIVGLEQPSAGEIRLDGKPVTGLDPKDRNMAMVFQSYALYPHLSVRENIAFPLRMARLSEPEVATRVAEAAEILGLGELLDRRPAALSGGQRQRVAMGRAIVRHPAAFLLDEPLSNLDAKLRGQMRAELARLQHRLGITTVYVTHDQTEAMTLGRRIAVLRDGEVQQVGTPQEIYREPANLFVAGFLGSPPMNLLPARIEGDRLVMPMTELPLPAALDGRAEPLPRELVVGIRPEHILSASAPGIDAATARFELPVGLVEWLGADMLVHLDLNAPGQAGTPTRLVARLAADSRVTEGRPLALRLDSAALHLFDPTTDLRIGNR